jgi:hypothetical protein
LSTTIPVLNGKEAEITMMKFIDYSFVTNKLGVGIHSL